MLFCMQGMPGSTTFSHQFRVCIGDLVVGVDRRHSVQHNKQLFHPALTPPAGPRAGQHFGPGLKRNQDTSACEVFSPTLHPLIVRTTIDVDEAEYVCIND